MKVIVLIFSILLTLNSTLSNKVKIKNSKISKNEFKNEILNIVKNFTQKIEQEVSQSDSLLTGRINQIEFDLLKLKSKSTKTKIPSNDSTLNYKLELKEMKILVKEQQKFINKIEQRLFAFNFLFVIFVIFITFLVINFSIIETQTQNSNIVRII